MKKLLMTALLAAAPALGSAQSVGVAAMVRPRSFSLLAGIGNTLGWFGAQGERYFTNDRFSLIGGIGYTPAASAGDPSGITFAAGGRAYTGGKRHRGFVEVSVSQLALQQGCSDNCRRFYGPGIEAGYQYVARGGFTLLLSGGVGYTPSIDPGATRTWGMLGLGVGYTWRH